MARPAGRRRAKRRARDEVPTARLVGVAFAGGALLPLTAFATYVLLGAFWDAGPTFLYGGLAGLLLAAAWVAWQLGGRVALAAAVAGFAFTLGTGALWLRRLA